MKKHYQSDHDAPRNTDVNKYSRIPEIQIVDCEFPALMKAISDAEKIRDDYFRWCNRFVSESIKKD